MGRRAFPVAVFALLLAALAPVALSGSASAPGSWAVFHYDVTHTGVNPSETVLKPSNVGKLKVRWQRKLPKVNGGVVNSSVEVGSNAVYVGNGDGYLYSFRRPGGALRWRAKAGVSIQSSPAIAGGIVYIGSNDGYLYAFRSKTGARLWRVKTGLIVGSSSPTVVDGVVYMGTLT